MQHSRFCLTASVFLLAACAVSSPERPQSLKDADVDREARKSAPVLNRDTEEPILTPEPSLESDATLIRRLSGYPEKEAEREILLRVFPQEAAVLELRNGELTTSGLLKRERDTGWYSTAAGALGIRAPGFRTAVIPTPDGDDPAEVKLERLTDVSRRIGELPTGYQPKSVRFSPDGGYLFTTHLGDRIPVTQYSVSPFKKIRDWQVPEEYRDNAGFVETVILPERGELWVSQMDGSRVHVFNLENGDHLGTAALSGRWPKVLLATADETRVYASCWISSSISEIDTATRTEIRSIPVGSTPRGMSFARNETEILVARFSDSSVERVDLDLGKVVDVYDAAPGRKMAMRHIVHDAARKEYYVTAMGAGRVYRLSEDGEWLGYWTVGDKPNTCALSPDGRRLIVSCRGPNNPDTGYLTRGYEYGKVFFIDLELGEVSEWIWGRDQTTGLDISHDGRYLAFTDFLSRNLELYRLY